jgi:hypothetical protein
MISTVERECVKDAAIARNRQTDSFGVIDSREAVVGLLGAVKLAFNSYLGE